MNVWEVQNKVSRRLLVWSGVSVAAGIALLFTGPFWMGVGIGAVAWGVVDAAIALIGGWVARRRWGRRCTVSPGSTQARIPTAGSEWAKVSSRRSFPHSLIVSPPSRMLARVEEGCLEILCR
jgi:hypothetical protein